MDPYLKARALLDLGGCAEWSGDLDRGRAGYESALELFRQIDDERGIAEARFRLGVVAAREGEVELARELWQESLEEWERLGDDAGVTQALGNLGWWEFEHGEDREHAWELTERSLVLARRLGWQWWEINQLGELAERTLDIGNFEGASGAHANISPVPGNRGPLGHDARARDACVGCCRAWRPREGGHPLGGDRVEAARAPDVQWAWARDKYAAHVGGRAATSGSPRAGASGGVRTVR